MAPFKNMPKCVELYLQNNALTSMLGAEGLGALKKLNLRHNNIAAIEEEGVPDQYPALEYLNLRTNKLPSMEHVHRLLQFPAIVDINVINNPVELGFSSMNIMICQALSKVASSKL